MEIALDEANVVYRIQAYEPGSIKISEQEYRQSLIVSPTTLITPWSVQDVTELQCEDCAVIANLAPKIVLLGTGSQSIRPPAEIFAYFNKLRMGVEVMTNDAACRTYSVLTAEGRNVVAAFCITEPKVVRN